MTQQSILTQQSSRLGTLTGEMLVLVASAWVASEQAARSAADSVEFARIMGDGDDDACEAIRAAIRSRQAAEAAERADDIEACRSASRMAMAAATTAREALVRVQVVVEG